MAVYRCHVGGLNASLIMLREVFKSAILNNSASIIVGHQPSQDVTPSREDVGLSECGKIIGIEVLDHVIVNAKADYFGMEEHGVL